MNTIDILYFFGFIGVLDTLYLIYHKVEKTDVTCPIFKEEWCHKVQYSPQSQTFGIPNSYAGFATYVGILLATYLYAGGSVAFWPVQALVTFGFIFSMYFTYVQAFVLRAFCSWCVISAINFIMMFLVVWF